MLLGIGVVNADEVTTEPEVLWLADYIGDAPLIGHWFAQPSQVDGIWEAYNDLDAYAAVTFFAKKPFSSIEIPYWAGNPSQFPGIVEGEVELALFKATPGAAVTADEYNSDDAVRRDVITTNCDNQLFVWNFEQVPGGTYCLRIKLLTEEGAYFVLSVGEPNEVDCEFDIYGLTGGSDDAFIANIVFDEGEEVTPEPAATPKPTEAPTATPEETTAPEETAAPDNTKAPDATKAPDSGSDGASDSASSSTKKGCGGVIAISGISAVALAAAVLVVKKKSK